MDNVEVFVEDSSAVGSQPCSALYQGVPLQSGEQLHLGGAGSHHAVPFHHRTRVGPGNEDGFATSWPHVVAHEVAHHFGISDERLKEIDAY